MEDSPCDLMVEDEYDLSSDDDAMNDEPIDIIEPLKRKHVTNRDYYSVCIRFIFNRFWKFMTNDWAKRLL